jgi:hypothetical protein
VLRDSAQANKFFLYEIYVDEAAFAFHQTTPHFQPWVQFKVREKLITLFDYVISSQWVQTYHSMTHHRSELGRCH